MHQTHCWPYPVITNRLEGPYWGHTNIDDVALGSLSRHWHNPPHARLAKALDVQAVQPARLGLRAPEEFPDRYEIALQTTCHNGLVDLLDPAVVIRHDGIGTCIARDQLFLGNGRDVSRALLDTTCGRHVRYRCDYLQSRHGRVSVRRD
jgi:hypothetical protein